MAEWRSSELCLRLRAIDSVPAMLDGFDTVERLATSRDHMVPGHDRLVAVIYPAAVRGIEGRTARLDADSTLIRVSAVGVAARRLIGGDHGQTRG